MPRLTSQRVQSAPVESGPLRESLPRHAFERIRHFFLFCFYVELTCDYVETLHGIKFNPLHVTTHCATHQVDSGTRLKSGAPLNKKSKQPLEESTTGHSRMDAAHFNNLGLTADFLRRLDRLGDDDEMVSELRSRCIDMCRNTRLLPQAINLGPDKVIDRIHETVRLRTFDASATEPCISVTNIRLYLDMAVSALKIMTDRKAHEPTLQATGDLYIEGLTRAESELARTLYDEVDGMVTAINRHVAQMLADQKQLKGGGAKKRSLSTMQNAPTVSTSTGSSPRRIIRAKRMSRAKPPSPGVEDIFSNSFYADM